MSVRYPVNSLRDRVARGIASKEEVRALCDHAERGKLCNCAAEAAQRREMSESNLPEQYRGRWSYDYSDKLQRFQICTGGHCVAETEDSEVADLICKLKNGSPIESAPATGNDYCDNDETAEFLKREDAPATEATRRYMGPFNKYEDYPADSPAPEAKGMEQRAREWRKAQGFNENDPFEIVSELAAFARAEVVRALEPLAPLADWLENEAEKLAGQAIAREESANCMVGATRAELRVAKKLSEKMAGRRLPNVSTDPEEAKEYGEMQSRIAKKLDAQSKQLVIWAAAIRKQIEEVKRG